MLTKNLYNSHIMKKISLAILFVLFYLVSAGYVYAGVRWTVDGEAVCNEGNDQRNPAITGDGTGGAIVTWHDNRNGNYDIYAQRIDESGNLKWVINGASVCTQGSSDQYSPAISGDGTGGAIITWEDFRNGNHDIYAQRIDENGNVKWVINGAAVCTQGNGQWFPTITGDGTGGAIIAWQDDRNVNYDIYAQRIDEDGNLLWGADAAICTQGNYQYNPAITGDGTGGAIITWMDFRNGNHDIYAQRIDENGNLKWVINGASVCTPGNNQWCPEIIGDGTGGAIITWYDYRNGNTDIFAQRIDESGNLLWGADAAVCTGGDDQYNPAITGDGTGGAIITWHDFRWDVNGDICAQRIDENGNVKWAINGVPVCTQGSVQVLPAISGDGTRGAIITWQDGRNGNVDIYAQRISNPAPVITSINPQSAVAGDTLDVTVSGSWFYINPSAIFSGAGITLNAVSHVSEAELTVNITISRDAATGTRDVTVTNLDGQSGTKTRAFEVMGTGEGKVKIQAGSEGWANPLRGENVNIYLKPKHSGNVSIEIYTIAGQLVWDKEISATGGIQEQVIWNCRNKSDEVVSSGIYAVHVKGGGIDKVKKVAVVK
ncbi:hypothetical protein ES707_20113 [subsurface metagenome]